MKCREMIVLLFIFIICGQAFTVNYYETTTDVTLDPCHKKLVTKADLIEECTKESRVDRTYISKMKIGYWSMPKITTSLKYWAFCYLRKLDIMTDAGVLRQDVVLKKITKKEKDTVVKIIDKCLYNKAHLPIDTAWRYLNCFHRTNSKLCKRIHGI